jgi:type IV pilus assembly protein PilO
MASLNLRDPKVQRLLLVGAFAAGSIYVFLATSYLPVNYPVAAERIKELKADFEKKSNDLARARQSVADLPRFQAEFAALHERYELAAELLPSEREMPGLLRRLTLAGQQCGVRFEIFKPEPEVVKEHYTEMPIQIAVVGGYHQVGQFLAEVANMPRIVKVTQLQVLNYDKGEDGQTTEARFVASAYTLNPEGPKASTAKATGTQGANASSAGGEHAGTAK